MSLIEHNKNALEIFNKLASIYKERFMNVDFYADSFQFLCDSNSKERIKILELACGPENITYVLIASSA